MSRLNDTADASRGGGQHRSFTHAATTANSPVRNATTVLIASKALEEHGGVVNVVGTLLSHFDKDINAEHFSLGHKRANTVSKLSKNVIHVLRLVKAARSGRWDCIHLNPSFKPVTLLRDLAAVVALRLAGYRRILLFVHGWEPAFARKVRSSRLLAGAVASGFNRAERILVLSSEFERDLHGMGVHPQKTGVISTMFDGAIFEGLPIPRREKVRRLLFLGRLVSDKGVFELLEAFKALVREHDDITLSIAGDGPDKQRMVAFVEKHALERHVDFHGYVRGREKAELLTRSDLFVFPTYYGEGCPVALLEAMAAGLPVIAGSAGGIPDVMGEDNGILLHRVSAETVYNALQAMLAVQDRTSAIGEINRDKAWRMYEASPVTRKIERHYRDLGRRSNGDQSIATRSGNSEGR